MNAKINEVITGEYNHVGKATVYSDTDSVTGDTMIETSQGPMAIEELFNQCIDRYDDQGSNKKYAYDDDIMVMSYCSIRNEPYLGHIDYVYKHAVEKNLYDIEDDDGNVVTVTEDHSVMVERDGQLLEVKPAEILDDDILISLQNQ